MKCFPRFAGFVFFSNQKSQLEQSFRRYVSTNNFVIQTNSERDMFYLICICSIYIYFMINSSKDHISYALCDFLSVFAHAPSGKLASSI